MSFKYRLIKNGLSINFLKRTDISKINLPQAITYVPIRFHGQFTIKNGKCSKFPKLNSIKTYSER